MNDALSQVTRFELGQGQLFVMPTKTKDVVAVEGSVLGGPNFFVHKNEMLAVLTAELFDAGTASKKKNVLRDALAARGISLAFSAGGDRTQFSGQCFPEDLPFLLSVIAECLAGANFPEAEIKAAKARELGSLAEEKSNTKALAGIALSRLLYDPSHTNYAETIESLEKEVRGVRRSDIVSFQKQLGTSGLILAVTGDVEKKYVYDAAAKAFRKLKKGTLVPVPKKQNSKTQHADEKTIPIADKANIDVYLGAALPLTKRDDLYHSALVAVDMLGGGFASHLMQTIRERDGLTYGVRASLSGLEDGTDGFFKVWATFSPERYAESVDKLRQEIKNFFATGLTEEALTRKKEEIAGSYLVSLSTTRGLAHALHQLAADGRDISYLGEYPSIIRALSLADVHKAADLIPFSKLSLAAAGTFKK